MAVAAPLRSIRCLNCKERFRQKTSYQKFCSGPCATSYRKVRHEIEWQKKNYNAKGLKYCLRCKKFEDPLLFGKDARKKDGLSQYCFVSTKAYRKANEGRWREKNPNYYRDYMLRYKYGISLQDYNKLVRSQKGRCLGCRKKKHLFVDHCHETNTVRGLLCNECNLLVGLSHDQSLTLHRLADYLDRFWKGRVSAA